MKDINKVMDKLMEKHRKHPEISLRRYSRCYVNTQLVQQFREMSDDDIPKIMNEQQLSAYIFLRSDDFNRILLSFLLTPKEDASYNAKKRELAEFIERLASRITWESKKLRRAQYRVKLFDIFGSCEYNFGWALKSRAEDEGVVDTSYLTEEFVRQQKKKYYRLKKRIVKLLADPKLVEIYASLIEKYIDECCTI